MNKTYNIKMSDGRQVRIECAPSAADAINQALWNCRGLTVKRCYQGFDGQDTKGMFAKTGVGGIEYEVPAHEAISPDAKKPVNRRPKDNSEVMAFMEEIKP